MRREPAEPGDSFARSSVYNFMPEEAITLTIPNGKTSGTKGFDFLKEIHQYMYSSGGSIVYPNKNQGTLDLLNQGEIDMCPTGPIWCCPSVRTEH